jgi:hypothetical protein
VTCWAPTATSATRCQVWASSFSLQCRMLLTGMCVNFFVYSTHRMLSVAQTQCSACDCPALALKAVFTCVQLRTSV